MTEALNRLTDEDLRQLSDAIRAGRLVPPFSALSLGRYIGGDRAGGAAAVIDRLSREGMKPEQIALMLELLAADRSLRVPLVDAVDLVSTGPEAPGVANRDTAVVVRELFLSARESVLVAGYAVYQGRQVFSALAERMDALPTLRVRMFLDVKRPREDSSLPSEVLARFRERFKQREWPGSRLPEVYYDPRSLDPDPSKRASLHAKCIVVDGERAFVSSANFTEAAQVRNVEVGLLVQSDTIARRLSNHFEALAGSGTLIPVPGL